jgi:ABC-type transporter Mla subunit MlaD
MDTPDVDREYDRLEQSARQTANHIKALSQKLSDAAAQGDPNAREWNLDLREVAAALRDEEQQMRALLNALDQQAEARAREMAYQANQANQAAYRQPVYYGGGYGGYGGGFFGGGFGQALAMGAGFGLGEEIIDDLF